MRDTRIEKWKLHIVSHTHWDREWYMTFQQFRRRFVKMMDHLLEIFEKNPDFKSFTMDGQTIVLNDYLEIRPEKKEQVDKLVKSGKLIIGPWFTQPNEFMVSGEAMIRNLILGYRECEKFGKVMKVCYLPDAFGHISQLPQMMAGFGMRDAVLWRGLPRGYQTVFKWKGADGTECLVFNLISAYGNASDLPVSLEDFTRINDSTEFQFKGLRERIGNIMSRLSPRAADPHLLLFNGVDHTFAQADLPDIIKKINTVIPGVEAVQASLPSHISEVRKYHDDANTPFQTASGELRDPSEGEILPASQSTRTDVKIQSFLTESMFEKWMEPFSAYCWLLGHQYPQAEIWKAWTYLLENHAHDSMACSNVDPSYHQVMTRFEWAMELGQDIIAEQLQKICNGISRSGGVSEKTLAVFNPLGWERSELVTATVDIPSAMKIKFPKLMDGEREIPMIVSSVRMAADVVKYNPRKGHPDGISVDRYVISFKADDVPANGYKALKITEGGKAKRLQGGMLKSANVIENEYLRVTINHNGSFDIFDKRTKHKSRSVHYFEDSGECGNGFVREVPAGDKIINSLSSSAKITLVENSPLKTRFKIETVMHLPEGLAPGRNARSKKCVACKISSSITLEAGSPRIDVRTVVDNRAKDHRLRVVVPSNIKSNYSYAEQPFDVVRRNVKLPDLNSYPKEKPMPFHPQLSFADVSDGEKGMMLVNHGLYEYEVKDDEPRSIALTLLRCLDRIYGGAFSTCEEIWIPEAQCLGEQVFNYSIIPHSGTWIDAYRDAKEYLHPMKAVIERPLEEESLTNYRPPENVPPLPARNAFIEIGSGNISLSAVKKHESRESLVIRVFNLTDRTVSSHVKLNVPQGKIVRAFAVNLNEERIRKVTVVNGNKIEFKLKKKEIMTLEMEIGA
ncbi:MAG: glycoside hydrolase family 38 C-terminal domain-containing protein [Victivallales bacterium]|jgi:alpha-mannosidase